MKARPIIFSTPMVQALLAGKKTQTRRIVNAKWLPLVEEVLRCNGKWIFEAMDYDLTTPYGNIGHLLYVRETFVIENDRDYFGESLPQDNRPIKLNIPPEGFSQFHYIPHYKATDGEPHIVHEDLMDSDDDRTRWKPSIYMPRWASRITLENTNIRVERLQDISEEDAIAEGIYMCDSGYFWWDSGTQKSCYRSATSAYAGLWELINGKASWDANPFVWILGFKVHKCNVDKFIQKKAA